MAGDVSFLYQVCDSFSARNMLLWPRKWQICDAELGRLKKKMYISSVVSYFLIFQMESL